MVLWTAALFITLVNAWPRNEGDVLNHQPNSDAVIAALQDPSLYDQLARHHRHHNIDGQTPVSNILGHSDHKDTSCGARTGCPAYDGQTRRMNGREYKLYCYNAPWGSYLWLPKSKTLEECEKHCHSNSHECNGLTFYPSTGACSIITSENARPYIWDNGYGKIGAVPVKSNVAFGPGELCPLPGSDNQVWDFGNKKSEKYRFKVSCRNQLHVDPEDKKQMDTVMNADECAEECAKDRGCHGFHYYQPDFPGGRTDGMRSCELIMMKPKGDQFVPLHRPNQYLAGLRVEHKDCGDKGWNRDE